MLLIAAWLSLSLPASAQLGGGSPVLSGYLKDDFYDHRTFLDDMPSWENLTRARLELDLRGHPIGAFADYDQELFTGTYLRSLDRKVFGLTGPPTYLGLDWTISNGDDEFWHQRFYRVYVEGTSGDWYARAGRQLIAWGTGKLWNPTDVLNPYLPLTLERDERQGVDAVYARRELGNLSRVEAVYAPMSSWGASSALARVHSNAAETDLSLMGGKPSTGAEAWMVGGDAARDFGWCALHAEWSYTGGPGSAWRYVAGWEKTLGSPSWLKDGWLLAEYYHNGFGASSPGFYDYAALLAGKSTALARDYLGFAFREDLHPLVKLEVYAVTNLNDGGVFAGPSLIWSALTSLELTAGWQHFAGAASAEFGRLPDIGYLQGKFFF